MRKLLVVAMMASFASPVLAQGSATTAPEQSDHKGGRDPNRVICRTSDVLGSRLQRQRTCLTASEWREMEREQRQQVDRIQALKPVNGG